MTGTAELLPPPSVAGISLDGPGPYVITAAQNDGVCRSTGIAPAPGGFAHPIYYYIATQVAMGKSVTELCRACAFDVEDGPIMASSRATFAAPLRVDTPYTVKGEISALTRKRSRKLGVMDVLEYRVSLHDAAGEMTVECTNVWMLPRRELA